MKQAEIQTKLSINNNHLNKQKDNHPFHSIVDPPFRTVN